MVEVAVVYAPLALAMSRSLPSLTCPAAVISNSAIEVPDDCVSVYTE